MNKVINNENKNLNSVLHKTDVSDSLLREKAKEYAKFIYDDWTSV